MITAEQIVESQVWENAVSAIRARIHSEFERIHPGDATGLEHLAHRLKSLNELQIEVETQMASVSINKPALYKAGAAPARSGK